MLFAVIVGHAPGTRGDAQWCDDERRKFLEALKRSGRLILEGTYGESGTLMLIEADSTNDALALLQNDPYVLASSRVQIRPLTVNLIGNLRDGRSGEHRAKQRRNLQRRGDVRVIEGRKGHDLG